MAPVLFGRLLLPAFGWRSASIGWLFALATLCAQPETAPQPSLQELANQNRLLQEQVTQQQKLIDALQARMSALEERAASASGPPPAAPAATAASPEAPPPALPAGGGSGDLPVRISAEVGLAYFQSGPSFGSMKRGSISRRRCGGTSFFIPKPT